MPTHELKLEAARVRALLPMINLYYLRSSIITYENL